MGIVILAGSLMDRLHANGLPRPDEPYLFDPDMNTNSEF